MTSNRKRTLTDIAISGIKRAMYSLSEPALLHFARQKYESLYSNTSDEPLISVYVPTYNRGKLLMKRAVPSVLAQTYKNFEFIIVGDCCTDNTAQLVEGLDDKRVRFYNLPVRKYRYPPTAENHWLAGPVVPANQALDMVRGKWIARIDDDDTWTTDHLETLLNFARRENHEFVSAAYETERHGKRIIVNVKDEKPRIGGTQTWLYRSYLKFFRYNIHCWRKSWNRVNDTDLQERIHRAGARMGFLDRVVAYVLPRPGETTVGLEAYRASEQEKLQHFKF